MYIVKHRKLFFWITGLLLALAIGSVSLFGLTLGIEFTGGSLVQASYADGRPALSEVRTQMETLSLGEISVRTAGENAIAIRTRTLSEDEHMAILTALGDKATEESFTTVGPSLGDQFTKKASIAVLSVFLAVVLYIALVFRKVSRPVPSWGYGLTVVAMLAIDIIVPTGFYSAWGHYTGAEVDSLFVVALLALLGYCVNDVIVVFDRVRERLSRNSKTNVKEAFEDTVGHSIDQTIARSINTSLTVALVLGALIFFGAEATQNFALVMLVGVIAGTFSSIARSAPLLIPLAKHFNKE